MKLLLKFNLVFLLIFAAGLAATGRVSWQLLERNARAEISENARLLMDTAIAARGYTSKQIAPVLQTQMKYSFLPQSVPAYSATEVFGDLNKKHTEYTYKEATLNPTNPRDRAVEWEADIVQQFRNDSNRTEIRGERETPTGKALYLAKPLTIKDPGCIPCHDTPDTAPKSMVAHYGPANGFGWKLNETVGAQIISVPMSVPLAKADQAFRTFMTSLVGVFLLAFIVLNVVLSLLVIRPIVRMSKAADEVSTGNFDVPEFSVGRRDEIGVLATSFNRLRRSLEKAMKLLE